MNFQSCLQDRFKSTRVQRGYMRRNKWKNTHTHANNTQKLREKRVHSKNSRRHSTDEKAHHDTITTITGKNLLDMTAGMTTQLERPWSTETRPRHGTIDIVERQRASETTPVSRVWPKGHTYIWAWAAQPERPGPKILSRAGSGLHFGPGSGLKSEPERRAGPGSGLHFRAF
jgi:hypothetical protein